MIAHWGFIFVRGCTRPSFLCSPSLPVAVRGPSSAATASLVVQCRFEPRGFCSRSTWAQQLWLPGSRAQAQGGGAQAQLLRGTFYLPGSGIAHVSLALADRLSTPEPPGKYLTVLSSHSCLLTNDVEHLFMPSFAIHIPSLVVSVPVSANFN